MEGGRLLGGRRHLHARQHHRRDRASSQRAGRWAAAAARAERAAVALAAQRDSREGGQGALASSSPRAHLELGASRSRRDLRGLPPPTDALGVAVARAFGGQALCAARRVGAGAAQRDPAQRRGSHPAPGLAAPRAPSLGRARAISRAISRATSRRCGWRIRAAAPSPSPPSSARTTSAPPMTTWASGGRCSCGCRRDLASSSPRAPLPLLTLLRSLHV